MIKFLLNLLLFVPAFINGVRMELCHSRGDEIGLKRLENNGVARASKKIKEMS